MHQDNCAYDDHPYCAGVIGEATWRMSTLDNWLPFETNYIAPHLEKTGIADLMSLLVPTQFTYIFLFCSIIITES